MPGAPSSFFCLVARPGAPCLRPPTCLRRSTFRQRFFCHTQEVLLCHGHLAARANAGADQRRVPRHGKSRTTRRRAKLGKRQRLVPAHRSVSCVSLFADSFVVRLLSLVFPLRYYQGTSSVLAPSRTFLRILRNHPEILVMFHLIPESAQLQASFCATSRGALREFRLMSSHVFLRRVVRRRSGGVVLCVSRRLWQRLNRRCKSITPKQRHIDIRRTETSVASLVSGCWWRSSGTVWGLGSFSPVIVTSASLLGAPGIATRSKDATRGSWPYY